MSNVSYVSVRALVICLAGAALLSASCDDSSDGGFTSTTLAAPPTTPGGASTTLGGGCNTTTTFDGVGSTTTIQPGTTLSTTTSSTTLVTIVEPPPGCTITWSVTNDVTLGALQFTVDYADAPGEFQGSDDFVECDEVSDALYSFNDDDEQKKLTAGFISIDGIDAPTQVMECNFGRSSLVFPDPSHITITVVDAADPELAPVTAVVEITDIECIPRSSTTTTVPNYASIRLDLAEEIAIGALQLVVDYSTAAGGFVRAGEDVACGFPTQPDSYASFFNDTDSSRLAASFVSLGGLSGPRTLAECVFVPEGDILASDFDVAVVEAMGPDLTPIEPLPTVTVEVFQ